ncbi:MAG: AI-2E family transporter [Actinobacteria bacterium]|nr:AI-2E family transporter [Actinomycetota bacterium]
MPPEHEPEHAHVHVPAWRSDRPTIRWGAYAWAFLGLALAFVVLWRGLGYVRVVVVPLVLALFLAAVLTPGARWLEARRVPPGVAAGAMMLGFLVLLAAIGTVIVFNIESQFDDLAAAAEATYRDLRPDFDRIPFLPDADDLFGSAEETGTAAVASSGEAGAEEAGEEQSVRAAAVAGLGSLARIATEFALFLVIAFFYVKDRRRITRWLCRNFPRARRADAYEIVERTWETVAGYIRAQAVIAAVDAVAIGIGLVLLDVPLAVSLAVLVFIGAFVPVVGAFVSGGVAVAVAFASRGLGTALLVLVLVVAVQQLEGHVLAPVILGRELELHPIAVVVALTAGAVLLGIFGAIIAVPLAASAYRAAVYLRSHERLGDDAPPVPDPTPTGPLPASAP